MDTYYVSLKRRPCGVCKTVTGKTFISREALRGDNTNYLCVKCVGNHLTPNVHPQLITVPINLLRIAEDYVRSRVTDSRLRRAHLPFGDAFVQGFYTNNSDVQLNGDVLIINGKKISKDAMSGLFYYIILRRVELYTRGNERKITRDDIYCPVCLSNMYDTGGRQTTQNGATGVVYHCLSDSCCKTLGAKERQYIYDGTIFEKVNSPLRRGM